tara:strand:+ start:1116 stop:1556 length:441 start_codon:yes stop_codon:yes gene_type:complete
MSNIINGSISLFIGILLVWGLSLSFDVISTLEYVDNIIIAEDGGVNYIVLFFHDLAMIFSLYFFIVLLFLFLKRKKIYSVNIFIVQLPIALISILSIYRLVAGNGFSAASYLEYSVLKDLLAAVGLVIIFYGLSYFTSTDRALSSD